MDTASDKALQRFAELMIEKIQQVEDNWQQPWFSTKGGGLPQNIDGRNYNGVNSFMLFLLTEKEQYGMPVYMTFMQAKAFSPIIAKTARLSRASSSGCMALC